MSIKKFIEYWNSINEIFENPVSINWDSNDNVLVGYFNINEDDYIIRCETDRDNVWSYKFFYVDDNGDEVSFLTDRLENKFRVLGTIREGMKYLIDLKNPEGLIINVTDNSRGRRVLYERFCQELKELYGYEYIHREFISIEVFLLWKNDFNIVSQAASRI